METVQEVEWFNSKIVLPAKNEACLVKGIGRVVLLESSPSEYWASRHKYVWREMFTSNYMSSYYSAEEYTQWTPLHELVGSPEE